MLDKPENPPAFPMALMPGFDIAEPGMSLRDWFAGQFAAAEVARGNDCLFSDYAHNAYALADAMLAERERSK